MPDLLTRIESIVGAKNLLRGKDPRDAYDHDITGHFRGRSLAVVRPANTAEVSELLKLANETGTPVVPQSGNTGLSGGGDPGGAGDAIILSSARMNRIIEINPTARIAVVEAGVILGDLHAAAEAQGLVFPLLFGARGSARIGGNLATNAGGSNVLRYGNARALCLGLEAVAADGTVIDLMSALHKDNTGYDLRDLLIGSEGTLAVITKAVLRLFPKPRAHATAMVALEDLDAALVLLNRLQEDSGFGVEAFEYMPKNYFRHLAQIDPEAPIPFAGEHEVNVMVELAATRPGDAAPDEDGVIPLQALLTDSLAAALEQGGVRDANIAQSEQQRAAMWKMREMAFEVSTRLGPPVTTDIAVPLDRVGEFLRRADQQMKALAPNADIVVVAHLGDGNLHYSLWPDPDDPQAVTPELKTAIVTAIEDIVQALGGSFSAEHGIGLYKRDTMARRKDAGALWAMRAIKAALDPKGILNPGKLLPPG